MCVFCTYYNKAPYTECLICKTPYKKEPDSTPNRIDYDFGDMVELLTELNRKHRQQAYSFHQQASPVSYLLDHCTVKVDVGRATGKTQYIMSNAGLDDVVVFKNWNAKNAYRGCPALLVTVGDLDDKHTMMMKIRGRVFKNIYMDECSSSLRYCASMFAPALKHHATIYVFGA